MKIQPPEIIVIFILALLTAPVYADDCCILSIFISGIKETGGNLMVAVFNSKETFLSKYPANKAKVKIANQRSNVMNVEFKLPIGEYAVSIYQDENINGRVDTNFIGMPVERYGFSNNARGLFGPPGYEDAKFYLSGERMEITVELK